ncbi:NADP-dependent oxidoreductase [Bacillus sp. D386]|uniref:NADP-dependent oxidoreductase n=1 Tax=Bacillus sp. D386 TaxID=2587155 RepID=UPI0027D8839B|nr:NADP-dependent oxidoreductase [Bacillus sp. D386]
MQNTKMKAIVIEEYGGQNALKEKVVEKPPLLDNQVLIEVKAASVNPIDWKLREGHLADQYAFEFPIILGLDVAGIVKEVGKHVVDFTNGDRVFARLDTTRYGAYAEYTAVDELLIAKIPDNLSFKEAASVPLAGMTAYQCLFDALEIMEGQKILIHGGAGGVGSYAIQLAKLKGAYVATTASKKNHGFLKELGADLCIDYHTENIEDKLTKYDAVLDTIGTSVQTASMKILRRGGRLVSIVDPPNEQLANRYGITEEFVWLNPNGNQLKELAKLLSEGRLKPVVGETFPLNEKGVKNAHELSESSHARGKIILVVD